MKKTALFFTIITGLFFSCSKEKLIDPDTEVFFNKKANVGIRSAGDDKYDVLGYGYDVTGEYLGPLSVKNPILDIERYERDYLSRLITGTPSFGGDQLHYGYSSEDYLKDVAKTSTVKGSINNKEITDKYFTGTFTNTSYFKNSYSYSSKYSFASLDAIRNRKYIRINDEISRLSQYLSPSFSEDLTRLSADRLVERYGTHVLTDFVVGGRYKLMFRSVITKTTDSSVKKKTVASGFTATLKKIGLTFNSDRVVETSETLVNENQDKELYVMFYGGNGTSMKYDLEKGMPTSIDIQSWENTLSLQNANLTSINWNETFPIYDFISDPVKKQQIKEAVERYIASREFDYLDIIPLYRYHSGARSNHIYLTEWKGKSFDINNNYVFERIEAYVLKNQVPGSSPLYRYYNLPTTSHYYTPTWEGATKSGTSFNYDNAIEGYVYTTASLETIPLYQYYKGSTNEFFYVYPYQTNLGDFTYQKIAFYAYPGL